MSWWQSLRDSGIGLIKELDKAVDRGAELFHEKVTPAIQSAAVQLDRSLDGSGDKIEEVAKRTYVDLDDRWQRFVVKNIDPLFGQARNAQLDEVGGLLISPQEVALNRAIAYSGIAFIAITVGGAVYPPSLLISVPAAFSMVLPVYDKARQSVKEQRRVTYHVISAINVTAIWLSGLIPAAIAATFLYYGAEKLLRVTEDRSHKGLIEVFSKQPRTVWLLRGGTEVQRPFEEVLPGDVVVVHAGGFMPVDGTVVEGMASIDQQMLTGEAQPAEKSPGDLVYASTVVLAGKIHVRVDKAGHETVAAKIGQVLNQTASYQLALQSKGSKAAHDAALPVLLLSGLALMTVGGDGALAMLNSSFGVNSRMSGPVTMLNMLNIASYNAILLKDGRSLEQLCEVDTVLFDKTGTLTLSQPNVAKIHVAGAFSETELLTFAAAAEHRQTHPIALAVLAEAAARGLSIPEIDDARYEVGYGIKVKVGKRRVEVGSNRFMHMEKIKVPREIEAQQTECHTRGHSLIMVAVDGHLAGAIELQPTIRPEAEAVIQALRKRGLKMVIISGDQEEPTRRLAEKLGMDRYFANILPEGKASLVEQLQREGKKVCFVGDGINDSIALKKANVSVSLRGATTVATDAAQVVLMQESLQQLPKLFALSEEMDSTMKAGTVASFVPGVVNVAGVFFLGWGFYQALGVAAGGLLVSMGIAMYPMYKHKKELAQLAQQAQLAQPPEVSAAPPQLPETSVVVVTA